MSTNFQLFIDFHSWVDTNQVVGTNESGNDASYIPIDALEQYWQSHRISSILNSCSHDTPISVSIDDILASYLRIFSILVYISTTQSAKINYIKGFIEQDINDKFLPFQSQPHVFPNAADGTQTFSQFEKDQWLFSPVILGPSRLWSKELLPRSILPFTVEKVISGTNGESIITKKCRTHPACGLPVSTIVSKEFDSSEMDFSFKNEMETYIALGNKMRPHIYANHFLQCYGSFKRGNKAFILLEYTNEGTLFDFFNRNELPLDRHELYDLWSGLSNLLVGLETIHSIEHVSKDIHSGTIRCVHQDLKPSNIFVFKGGNNTSYRYHFKIGDFGMSSVSLVRTSNKFIKSPDNVSTKMYGAPELTHHYPDLDDVDYGVLWDADIWSMGCVLFEVLVWTTCGSRGLSEFFEMRRRETDIVPRHKAQGYSGCFHNGEVRIQAVDEMKTLVMQRRRVFDNLSEPIGDLILRDMLRPSYESRLEARTLLHRFGDILAAKVPQSDQQEAFGSNLSTGVAPGRGPRFGVTVEKDECYQLFEEHDLEGKPAVSQERHDCESKRLESTEPHASGSHIGSHNSRRGASESHSSVQTHPTHPTTTKPSEERYWQPSSVEADPRLISQLSINTGLHAIDHLISNPAQLDLEREQAHPQVNGSRQLGDPAPSDYRSPGANSLHGSLAAVSMRKDQRPEPYALVTIFEVLEWIDNKKNGETPVPLRDYERVMREIKDREQIFVVDDSDTMRNRYWKQVVEVVHALGYLVKSADLAHIKLYLTSRPTEPKKCGKKDIRSLVRFLSEHKQSPPVGTCNMENSLGPVLEYVKSGLKSPKRPKFLQQTRRGTNVYILTDAIWEGGTGVRCGVEEPIKNLSRAMLKMGKTRATVALQFIQFGDDTLGEERLRYLKDTLGTKLDFGIVDHRHSQRDGVWHMFMGSISRVLDQGNITGGQAAIIN